MRTLTSDSKPLLILAPLRACGYAPVTSGTPAGKRDDVKAMDYAGSERCMQASTKQFGDSFADTDIPALSIRLHLGQNIIIDKQSSSHHNNDAILISCDVDLKISTSALRPGACWKKGVPGRRLGSLALPVAGDDPKANVVVMQLLDELGFNAVDADGGLTIRAA